MTEYKGCKYYSIQDFKEGKVPTIIPGVMLPTAMVYVNTGDSEKLTPLNTGVSIEDIISGKYTEEEFEEICRNFIDGYLSAMEEHKKLVAKKFTSKLKEE